MRSLCCLLLLALSAPAPAAEGPPTAPILRIEGGAHTSVVSSLAADAAGRYLVSGAYDKTARVWDLGDGRLLRVLRPPIGAGPEGAVHAVAISPDGRIVAVGGGIGVGWRSISLFLFDRASGRLLGRIGGLPGGVVGLAFSPDGSRLAAVMFNSVRVYSLPDASLLAEDAANPPYPRFVACSGSRRLVVACQEGTVRVYDWSLKRLVERAGATGRILCSLSVAPDGSHIALGYEFRVPVEILSGQDLSLVRTLPAPVPGRDIDLKHAGWPPDGHDLYVAGNYFVDGMAMLQIWRPAAGWASHSLPTGFRYRELPTICRMLPLRKGAVACGTEVSLAVVDAKGRGTLLGGLALRPSDAMWGPLPLSSDAMALGYHYVAGEALYRFSVGERSLRAAGDQIDLHDASTRAPGVEVTELRTPRLNGQPLVVNPANRHEGAHSVAVAPDGRRFILGTHRDVRCFASDGTPLWSANAYQTGLRVNISADGRVAAAALADGTMRWYRLADGKEILSLFPHTDRKRWVLWTPSGYYDCSPGGEDLIGWHVNNGPDQAADFFPASRFRDTYYRPGVVSRALKTLDESEALREDDEASGRKPRPAVVARALPPVVTIISPEEMDASSPTASVRYLARTADDAPVTGTKALVDGRPAAMARDLKVEAAGENEVRVPIPPRECEISLIAENKHGASVPATVRVRWKGAAPAAGFTIQPRLYVLAVGISAYQDPQLRLRFAAKDATDFVRSVQAQQGRGLYRQVVARTLTDAQATRDEIVDGLDWILHETTTKDVAMVFLSGHGVNDERGNYYFLPANLNREKLMRTGVPWSDIKRTVEQLAGKVLFFVDSCHSGNVIGGRKDLAVDATGFVNELASAENGAVVYASSTGSQVALEDPAWGNGAFTKALVEGLSGKAAYGGAGKVTVNMLDLWLSERVKELTAGRQTPTTTKPQTVPDFPIAVVK